MKLVHASPNSAREHLLKNVLESAGIPCVVRNDSLNVVVGEIPAGECWPELWVVDDADAEKAQRLLQVDATPPDAPHEDWCCAKCGESIESQFTACWQCGESRPGF